MFNWAYLSAILIPLFLVQAVFVRAVRGRLRKIERDPLAPLGNNQFISRAEIGASLDSLFFDSGEYQALRRLGISAPLIGVLISAILIAKVPGSSTPGTLQLPDLSSLFAGVFVGVLIALTNQVCLWWAELQFRKLRDRIDATLPNSPLIDFLDDSRNRVSSMVDQHRRALEEALRTTIDVARTQVQELVSESTSAIEGLNAVIAEGHTAIRDQQEIVVNASKASSDHVEQLATASADFRNVLSELKTHLGKTMTTFDATLQSLDGNATRLLDTSHDIQKNSASLLDSLGESHRAVLDGLASATSKTTAEISNLQTVVRDSATVANRVSEVTSSALSALESLPGSLIAATGAAGELMRNASRQAEQLTGELKTSSSQLQESTRNFATILTRSADEVAATSQKAITVQSALVTSAGGAANQFIKEFNVASANFRGTLSELQSNISSMTGRFDTTLQSLDGNATLLLNTSRDIQKNSASLLDSLGETQRTVLDGLSSATSKTTEEISRLQAVVRDSTTVANHVSGATSAALTTIKDLPASLTAATNAAGELMKNASRQAEQLTGELKTSTSQLQDSTRQFATRLTEAGNQLTNMSTQTINLLHAQSQKSSDASKSLETSAALLLEGSKASAAALKTVKDANRNLENAVVLLAQSTEETAKSMNSQLAILKNWPQVTNRMVDSARAFLDQELQKVANHLSKLSQDFAAQMQKATVPATTTTTTLNDHKVPAAPKSVPK